MVAFSGCDKANSAEYPDIRKEESSGITGLYIRARDDISIHNIIINRGNCLYTLSVFSGFYRNGVDKMLVSRYSNEPLTSDYIEQSIKNEETKEIAYKELNAGPKKLVENIDLKFGEEKVLPVYCKPLEVVFETNLGQCEYKFD